MLDHKSRPALLAIVGLLLLSGCASHERRPRQFPQTHLLPENEIRSDFADYVRSMRSLHPDFALRTDEERFESVRKRIESDISGAMTQLEVWRLFSRINPTLNDGHAGILMPDQFAWVQDYLEQGGTALPFSVHIDDEQRLFIATDLGPDIVAGDEVLAINGDPAGRIVEEMLARAHGDTLRFRRALVARRFALFYLQLFGDTTEYIVETRTGDGVRRTATVQGARSLSSELRHDAPSSEFFRFRVLDGNIGYLKAGSFDGQRAEAFFEFTDAAFAHFSDAGVKALIIDVRGNGGGDDPLWQRGLMENITSKPYRHVSRYKVRVTKDNADPGDVIGDVQTNEYNKLFTPSSDNPIRFDGPVFILIGPLTYSAAIQFAVAAQDYDIAKLAGAKTGGLSCQTGRSTTIPMKNTKLHAFTPMFTFVRPSGEGCDQGVVPDLLFPLAPDAVVELLRSHAVAQ